MNRVLALLSVLTVVAVVLSGCNRGSDGPDPTYRTFPAVEAADLDGDGDTDIAVTQGSLTSNGYYYYRANDVFLMVYLQDPASPGGFKMPALLPAGVGSAYVEIADINVDGHSDFLITDRGNISILFQEPTSPGAFSPASTSFALPYDVAIVGIADVNNDSRPDLMIQNYYGFGFGDGDLLIFLQSPDLPGSFPALSASIDIPSFPRDVAIADLNGDLKHDLVVVAGGALVMLQDPAASLTFLPPTTYPAGDFPQQVSVGDLNQDGRSDLAISSIVRTAEGDRGAVSILIQDSSRPGTFLPPTTYESGDFRSSTVAAGDLDGDGRPDLAVANGIRLSVPPNGNSVSIFLQDPMRPGEYLPPTLYAGAGTSISSLTLADLNADGRLDLLTLEYGDLRPEYANAVVLRFQDPTTPGSFLEYQTLTEHYSPQPESASAGGALNWLTLLSLLGAGFARRVKQRPRDLAGRARPLPAIRSLKPIKALAPILAVALAIAATSASAAKYGVGLNFAQGEGDMGNLFYSNLFDVRGYELGFLMDTDRKGRVFQNRFLASYVDGTADNFAIAGGNGRVEYQGLMLTNSFRFAFAPEANTQFWAGPSVYLGYQTFEHASGTASGMFYGVGPTLGLDFPSGPASALSLELAYRIGVQGLDDIDTGQFVFSNYVADEIIVRLGVLFGD